MEPSHPAPTPAGIDLHNGLIYCQATDLFSMRLVGQQLQLGQTRNSQSIMAGNVRTRYRGRGMSFAEVRPYQAGDDIRTIDWRVTARTQKPYTKLFEEERERPVFILIDMRSSMFFGSQHQFKCVYAARIAATLAWAACHAGDKMGAMILSDYGQWDLRPKRGKKAVLALVQALVNANKSLSNPAAQIGRSLSQFLHDATRIIKPGAMVYVISDGHDPKGIQAPLRTLTRHADVNFLHVSDPLEATLPAKGVMTVSNGHTRTAINLRSLGKPFSEHYRQQQNTLQHALIQARCLGLHAPVTHDAAAFLLRSFGGLRRATSGSNGGLHATV